jgi:hypothetical protein
MASISSFMVSAKEGLGFNLALKESLALRFLISNVIAEQ